MLACFCLLAFSSFTENAIELPPWCLPHTANVHVRVLECVPTATQVTMEAMSHDDWTKVQHYADWLEEGGFLNQVSLVYAHQEIHVSLPENAGSACVRVLSIGDDTTKEQSSLWPDENNSTDLSDTIPCSRIVADTELVLLPCTATNEDEVSNHTFNLEHAKEDYDRPMQQLYQEMQNPRPLVSCSYNCAVLNPNDWPRDALYIRVTPMGETDKDCLDHCMLQVQFSNSVECNCIGKSM